MSTSRKFFAEIFIAMVLALLLLLWGWTAGADDKGINFTYEIDGNAADSGATTSQGNRTIKDIQLLVGESKKCTLVFKHTGSGVTKAYTISSGVTLTGNFYLDIRPGAELVVNASSWIANAGRIIMATSQRVISTASTKTLYFTSDSLKYPCYNGGTTSVEMPSAKINTLTLASGIGVTKFSSDGTMVGNSNATVPTEAAVVTYITASRTYPPYYKQNLVVCPPDYSGTTYTHVSITAESITLSNSDKTETILESGVSVTAAITTSGANGLDTGAEAPSTLYFVYLCRYKSGTTVFALLSISATAPTGLSSYDYRRLVGEVYNNVYSNFLPSVRYDDRVTFLVPRVVYLNQTLFNGTLDNYKTFVLQQPLTTLVDAAGKVKALDVETGATGLYRNIQVISGTTNPTTQEWTSALYQDSGSFCGPTGLYNSIRFLWPYNGSGNIYAKANLNANYTSQSLYIWGYVLPR